MLNSKQTAIVFTVLIVISIMGGVIASYATATTHQTTTEIGPDENTPFNISLTYEPKSVLNVTNGTGTIPADNYTIFASDKIVQINSNETFTGGNVSVKYTYEPDYYVSGVAKTMLSVMIIVVLFGIITYATSKSKR